MAGLMTARICADHFQNVVIVDPEIKKAGREFAKKRVAQYDSLHAYLTFMVDGLRRLWPNFDTMIKEAGGVVCPGTLPLHFGGIPILTPQLYSTTMFKSTAGLEKTCSLPDTILIRRPKLEALLYRLLIGSSANCIQTIQGTVTGLVPSDNMSTIQTVNVRTTEGEEKDMKNVSLVIDCTGAAQRGTRWLKSAGFIPSSTKPSPNIKGRAGTTSDLRVIYDHKLYYVTVTFDNIGDLVQDLPSPGGFGQGFIYTYYTHYKWGNNSFILARMDDTRIVQLCCGGWANTHLPKNSEDIISYVHSVKGAQPPQVWVIKAVEMLLESERRGDITMTFKPLKIPAASFVQYHKIAQSLPSNFIAIGDSVAQINPVFGQGCTKALYGATILNSILHNCVPAAELGRLPENFSTLYFERSHGTVEDLWRVLAAVSVTSTKALVKGESRTREGAVARWYSYYAYRAAETVRRSIVFCQDLLMQA
ncbi:hypothetical protein PC9H_011143 [Pleurotus ostreatus]|uniref:FAD/NAD(P)-binding domain-containing protein n=1 Tax=Pleurotus ostreatus TaxID=5322 RepID=A0A8H6ZP43_PLEOS|nr:uncharacterized protein PC9H_011143 [Pleurotus ostreatus]KAF7422979.1 hypothetical protein PC9H_011143 [Pleurotus ostreatus]